jgi:hypothetical protein
VAERVRMGGPEWRDGYSIWCWCCRAYSAASWPSPAAGPRWQVTIPPLGPGLYAVTARVDGRPGAPVTCTGMIGMVEADPAPGTGPC